MKIVRRSLARNPPAFFDLPEEGRLLVKECYAMTRGTFQIFAQLTDTLSVPGNQLLMQFAKPTRPPGQAIGWSAMLFPKRLHLVSEEFARPRYDIESDPLFPKSYKFFVVVRPEDRDRALLAVLRNALASLQIGELHATAVGLMI